MYTYYFKLKGGVKTHICNDENEKANILYKRQIHNLNDDDIFAFFLHSDKCVFRLQPFAYGHDVSVFALDKQTKLHLCALKICSNIWTMINILLFKYAVQFLGAIVESLTNHWSNKKMPKLNLRNLNNWSQRSSSMYSEKKQVWNTFTWMIIFLQKNWDKKDQKQAIKFSYWAINFKSAFNKSRTYVSDRERGCRERKKKKDK